MLAKQEPVLPALANLFVDGKNDERRCLVFSVTFTLLVKCQMRFFARRHLPLLMLILILIGCESPEMKTLANVPRSVLLDEHPNMVSCVAFSPDGKTVVSGGSGGNATVWDIASLQNLTVLKWKEHIWSVTFSPDGSLLATGSSMEREEKAKRAGKPSAMVATLWRVKTGKRLTILKGALFTNPAFSVAFSPDGQTLAAGSMRAFDTRRCTVPLWNPRSGKLWRSLEGGMGYVYSVQFSPDGKTLATGGLASDEKTPSVKLWDVATGEVKTECKGLKGRVCSVVFSPDGKVLATAAVDDRNDIGELALWDVGEGKRRATLTGHRGYLEAVAFSHDGQLLASAGGNPFSKNAELILWDVKTLKPIVRLKGHKNSVTSVAFSPDDTMLVSGSQDGTVRLWYLRDKPPAKDKKDP